jgi:hypothetical protein
LELYFNDTGQYPTANSGRIVGCGPVLTPIACEWDEEFSNSNDTIYMSRLPGDPRTPNQDYYYDSDTDGTFYQIYARLENENDNDIPQSGGSNQVYTGTSCDGVDSCNYAISSPNIGPADNGHSLIVE